MLSPSKLKAMGETSAGIRERARRLYVLGLLILLSASPVSAQTPPADVVGAGAHWNQFASPQLGGLLFFAHRMFNDASPTYSFTAIEFVSVQKQPFRIGTLLQSGIAQHVKQIGPWRLYGIGMAGALTSATSTDSNVGFAGSYGTAAFAPIGKGWAVGPYLLFTEAKSGERQWAAGMIFSWGR